APGGAPHIGGAAIDLPPAPGDAPPAAPSIDADLLRADTRDPLRWWRLQFLGVDTPPDLPEPARLLAVQEAARWRAALQNLRDADAGIADALISALTRAVE